MTLIGGCGRGLEKGGNYLNKISVHEIKNKTKI